MCQIFFYQCEFWCNTNKMNYVFPVHTCRKNGLGRADLFFVVDDAFFWSNICCTVSIVNKTESSINQTLNKITLGIFLLI